MTSWVESDTEQSGRKMERRMRERHLDTTLLSTNEISGDIQIRREKVAQNSVAMGVDEIPKDFFFW